MRNKHVRFFLIWMALLNWPPVLIWIPFLRMLCWVPFLLWVNIPVQRLGLAQLMGKSYYKIQEFGAMPQTTLSWALIAIVWMLIAIGLTALTALLSSIRNKRKNEASNKPLERDE